jgi:hypothetical protein
MGTLHDTSQKETHLGTLTVRVERNEEAGEPEVKRLARLDLPTVEGSWTRANHVPFSALSDSTIAPARDRLEPHIKGQASLISEERVPHGRIPFRSTQANVTASLNRATNKGVSAIPPNIQRLISLFLQGKQES